MKKIFFAFFAGALVGLWIVDRYILMTREPYRPYIFTIPWVQAVVDELGPFTPHTWDPWIINN